VALFEGLDDSPTRIRRWLCSVPSMVIGGGQRLFDKATDRMHFRVREYTTLTNGVLVITYQSTGA
jgi:hypothetical protein